MGFIHNQRGEFDGAVDVLKRAIVARPGVPSFHITLAETYRNLGEAKRAEGCCRTALKLNPEYPEALCTLGLVLQASGRPAEAVEQFRRALEIRPGFAQAHRDLAMALRELGCHDEALEHLRTAVSMAPRYPAARGALCLLLLDRGEADEAVVHGQEAVKLQPDIAIYHHNLGNALHRLGRSGEARGAYLEALRLDPDLAHAHLQIGLTLKSDGQLAEAEPWFKQAIELEPENPWFWEQLAELQAERQEHAAAVLCWEQAIDLSPTERPAPRISLGWSLQEEGRLPEAVEQYRTALQLQPEAVMARINLGGIHEELGEMSQAEAAYRAAIAASPRTGLAHAKLATLLRPVCPMPTSPRSRNASPTPRRIRPPAHGYSSPSASSSTPGANSPRAAECARRANALNMDLAPGPRGYMPDLHAQYVNGIIRGFTPQLFERVAGGGLDDARPVFVFGLPRSGTTLVEQILASHSRIHGAGELRLTRKSFDAIPEVVNHPGPALEGIACLTPPAVHLLAERHLERLDQLAEGRPVERIVNKMPDNYIYLGLLAAMFPRAVFIHCRRDLRDVAVSCWTTDFRPESIPWASEPHYMGSRFAQYGRLMDHWRSVLPVPIHEVNYEDTVADLESTARSLVGACGLEYEPACLDFHRTRRRVKTASIGQVRQPLYSHSVARWRNYESTLDDLFRAIPCNGRPHASPNPGRLSPQDADDRPMTSR